MTRAKKTMSEEYRTSGSTTQWNIRAFGLDTMVFSEIKLRT